MTRPPVTHRVRTTVTVTAGALAADLALLAVGRAAGASFTVAGRSPEPVEIGALQVALSTLVPLVAALTLTALVGRRWPRVARWLPAVAVAVTALSLAAPLTAGTDAGTRLLLALMHLVVGGAYLVAVRRTVPATGHAVAVAR